MCRLSFFHPHDNVFWEQFISLQLEPGDRLAFSNVLCDIRRQAAWFIDDGKINKIQ